MGKCLLNIEIKYTCDFMKQTCQQIRRQRKSCHNCRHAIPADEIYCGKLRKTVNSPEGCKDFELEPVEYTVYRRM
jgi:hypothetical protein